MVAEILSVGTELLMGQIANTDAQYLSRRLSELGVTLYRHTTVGDNPSRVKQALGEALERADMVITTGGLGPTEDDLTKEMVGEFFGLHMELDEKSLEAVRTRMCRIGREMTENNNKQAYFPRGAIIMPNACGTAPGCIVEHDGKAVAVLPGPPREMKDMFERQLAPYLRRRSGEHIESRFLRVFGVANQNGRCSCCCSARRKSDAGPVLRGGRGDGAHQRPSAPRHGRRADDRPDGSGDSSPPRKCRLRRLAAPAKKCNTAYSLENTDGTRRASPRLKAAPAVCSFPILSTARSQRCGTMKAT